MIENFRDVGHIINDKIKNKIMYEKRIYRGGKIDEIKSLNEIGNPQIIINLISLKDSVKKYPNIKLIHFPILNKFEKYDTNLPDVRKWLNDIMITLSDPKLMFPVYIHCRSGRDRTGIVIASLLFLLDIPENIIKEEYLKSCDIKSMDKFKVMIEIALSGIKNSRIKNKKNYFNRVSLINLRKNFLI